MTTDAQTTDAQTTDAQTTEAVSAGGPVAFIGLGNIGTPMARRLLQWPGGLVVFDVRQAATEEFVDAGAIGAATPADAARVAEFVSIMVNNEDQVRAVLNGPDGVLAGAEASGRSQTIVAIHSTISAAGAVEMARNAATHHVLVIDAPVSGGAVGAAEGTLAVMAGGERDVIEACREPMAMFASLIKRFGPVGAGIQAKIVRNLISFASYAVAGEAMRIGEAAGINLGALGDVVRHSDRVTGGTGAIMLRRTTGPLADDDFLRPIFAHAVGLGTKDLELAAELADQLGVSAPFAQLAQSTLAEAMGVAGLSGPPQDGREAG